MLCLCDTLFLSGDALAVCPLSLSCVLCKGLEYVQWSAQAELFCPLEGPRGWGLLSIRPLPAHHDQTAA